MTLTDVLDQKISKIRFNYTPDTGNGLQEFQSQIRLSNGDVILMPNVPDTQRNLTEDYERGKTTSFKDAKRCGLASRLAFKNKKIIDIHFKYLDNKPLEDGRCIFELENGKFVTENNAGPQGLTDIDLRIMNKSQFEASKDAKLEYKSLRKDILVIDLGAK